VGGAPAHYAHVPDVVLLHQDPALNATVRTLYAILLSHKDKNTGLCYPSEETVAQEMGMKPRALRTALRVLEHLQWVSVEHGRYDPATKKRRSSNHYTFLLDSTGGFTRVHAHVLRDPTLPPEGKMGYMLLARKQRTADQTCHKSLAAIAKEAGISKATLTRWVSLVRRAGYLDATQHVFARAAERHVTFMPPPKKRLVNHAGAKSFGADSAGAFGSFSAGSIGSFSAGAYGSETACKGISLEEDTCEPGPASASSSLRDSSLEALKKIPPTKETDAAQPRHDAVASALFGEGSTAQNRATEVQQEGGGTRAPSGANPSANAVSRTCAARSSTQSSVAKQAHSSEGKPYPDALAAGRPAVKTEVATEPGRELVPLVALRLADLDPAWPQSRQERFWADWAARLFLRRVCRWNNTHRLDKDGRPLYTAYCDICYRILLSCGSQKFEQWVDYMADPAMEEQFCKGFHPVRAYWHKQPEILWGEYQAWAPYAQSLEARSQMRLAGVEHAHNYDHCLGCLLGTEEEDCFRRTGQEHRPDCLYGRSGPVQKDDWRLARLLDHLKENA
jgi:hypothetical protein